MKAAFSASTSAANEAGNFALSRNRKPSCGGSIGGTGAPGGGILDERRHRLAVVQSKGRDINKPSDLWIVAGFCDDRSAVGVANENHGTAMCRQNALGYGHIIRERYR